MKPEFLKRFTGFEWNEKKNKSNVRKHGLLFNEAQDAFYDKRSAFIKIMREGLVEERYILIGKTRKGRLWSGVNPIYRLMHTFDDASVVY
jgi:uncharacterized DUF497 family protein